MGKFITVNKIQCLKCWSFIESKHRHDYKSCACRSVFVDGGKSYLRRGWPKGNPAEWFVELSEWQEETELEEGEDDGTISNGAADGNHEAVQRLPGQHDG